MLKDGKSRDLIPLLDPVEGGMTQRIYHMTCALLRAGHEVRLLVTDKGMIQERREQFTSSQLLPDPQEEAARSRIS